MNSRLHTLGIIYDIHAQKMDAENLACAKGCATCCTRNVTLTTLEGRRLYDWICENAPELLAKVKSESDKPRQIPSYTMNGLTEIWLRGEEVPEEESDPAWGACPLLSEEGICQAYEARPFACRSMVSKTRCQGGGFAEMDEFTLTVNNVLLQYIEHTDDKGLTGNLTDMLRLFEDDGSRKSHENEEIQPPSASFVPNRAAQGLMVPPPHRERIGALMQEIQSRKG